MENANHTVLLCPPSAPPPLSPPPSEEWVQHVPKSFWTGLAVISAFSVIGSVQTCVLIYTVFCRRRRLPPKTAAALAALRERRRKNAVHELRAVQVDHDDEL